MQSASQGLQILVEDGMVGSFTIVTVSSTVRAQLVYTLLWTSLVICSAHTFYEYYTQQLPSSLEQMIPLKWCFVQDWSLYTCLNKCHVSEEDFHNHCQNLMLASCSNFYIANFNGEYCEELLVCVCTPHVVGHGFLHIRLYTVQTPHFNKSRNFLAVSTFLMTKKIDGGSYSHVFLKIDCSVIIKCFFITKFSNSLKQFF